MLTIITPTLVTPSVAKDPTPVAGATDSLRECVIYANGHAGTTIQLNPGLGVYTLSIPNAGGLQENAGATGDLDISAATVKASWGVAVIDQTAVDRVFQIIGASTVTFQNLWIEGGQAVDDGTNNAPAGGSLAHGGGILDGGGAGANLSLTNVTFFNNVARGGTGENAAGGGLYTAGAPSNTVALNNVTFLSNCAIGGSGTAGAPNGGTAGSAFGGAMYVSGDQVTLGGSYDTFTANRAVGGTGGAGLGGATGGTGGTGGSAFGGGVYLGAAPA